MLITAKEIVILIEWPACAPTAHVAVRSCRKFKKHCLNKIKIKAIVWYWKQENMSNYYTEH